MANHPSALKRHTQSLKKKANNQTNRHKLKTQMKKLKAAIEDSQKAEASAIAPKTFGLIDKAVQKGVLKKNTARRYKSRLAKAVNSIPAA